MSRWRTVADECSRVTVSRTKNLSTYMCCNRLNKKVQSLFNATQSRLSEGASLEAGLPLPLIYM